MNMRVGDRFCVFIARDRMEIMEGRYLKSFEMRLFQERSRKGVNSEFEET